MNRRFAFLLFILSLALGSSLLPLAAQSPTATVSALPRLVRFGGTVKDLNGNPMMGVNGVTFALYSEQTGGAALWLETQNVTADSNGHYAALLGSTKPDGLPAELFTSEQARWVGVQISGQAEQPRVLLVSAPYALKAGDAETIGGLPPSAFVLAAPGTPSSPSTSTTFIASTASSADVPAAGDVTGSGTVNFIPLWTTTSNIANSVLFQSGTGATAKIGVNNTAPATTLDVKGAGTIRGILNLPAAGVATAAAGKNSQPLNLAASSFNSTSSTALNQTFQWQAEPASNDTTAPSGTLNLLFGEGATKPSETGLHIASNGQITFAAGQTFPGTGTGDGTVTSVSTGAGLTGGPITGTGTLSIPSLGVTNAMLANSSLTVAPGAGLSGGGTVALGGTTTLNLAANTCTPGSALSALPFTCSPFATLGTNTFTGNETVNGNLSASSFSLGGTSFAFGSFGLQSAFLGFAGNTANTAFGNTAAGWEALAFDTASTGNTAVGAAALKSTNGTTADGNNTAVGIDALHTNTTGAANTAIGASSGATADNSPVTGNFNAAIGAFTAFSTGTLTNATAIGTSAEVSESNALVLGGINGVNNGTSVSVGIGTSAPGATLDVRDNGSGGNTISATTSALNNAVYGNNTAASGSGANGGYFITSSPQGTGVVGVNTGTGGTDYAGYFQGNVFITGNLSKGGGSFQIDHPLDPANKFLYHSFVESPDMMNVYNGNIVTNQHGLATVTLPDYFEALNRDFRYQLTVIGQFAQAIVAKEISGNRFTIRTSKPGVKVSWQVTGVRHDAYADAHRIQVEVEKPLQQQGRYLHPELFGAPAEQAIGYPVPAGSTQGERSPLKVAASLAQ